MTSWSATSITATVPSGATTGNVVVTVSGVASNGYNFTVNAAPSISSQPSSQTVTTGQTATFTVVASGTAPLNYQWQENGANISGATSSSYTTPTTTSADNGSTFQVIVTNSFGSVTSNTATLTVSSSSSSTIYYYIEDMLGSSRTIVQDGATAPCYDADFYPFGGERVIANACPQNYKFEGKERDAETGNDDFGARYYSSRFGRWLSADWSAVPAPVPYANLTNPQTLNLYGMVSDNPETFADLDGHCCAPYEVADYVDSKINAAVNYVENTAVASGNPTLAATATFAAGVTGDAGKGFTNLLRTGESIGSLPENASGGQIATAIAEEGGRVGGTILAVVAVAGPKTPATAESGAQVAGEIGKNRVTLDNGSQVDVAGRAHYGVDTPHIKDPTFNTNSQTGQVFQNKFGPVRPATVGDVNAAARTAGATPPVRIPPPVPVPPNKESH